MEHAAKNSLLPSQVKSNGLKDIEKFVYSFYKYLRRTEALQTATCKFDDKDASITPTPTPGSGTLQSPYNAICQSLEDTSPCLHEPIRELCLYIFGMLAKGLKVDNLSLTEEEINDLADALEALMLIAVSIRTAAKLYTCKKHQDLLMGNVDWPAPLIRKLVPYLLQHMDSIARIDRALLRALEIIVNPPQAFGASKAWLTIMREVEEDFILEDSQASKFLSFLFVMLNTEARVRLCGIYQEQVQQLLDADTIPTLSLETLAFINYMSCNNKTQQALIKNGVHTVLVEFLTELFMQRTDMSQVDNRGRFDIVMQILINLAQGLRKTALDEILNLLQSRAINYYKLHERNDIFTEIMAPIISAAPFSSFIPISLNIGESLVGNNELKPQSTTHALLEEGGISMLNSQQNRQLKELIQNHHFNVKPFEKCDIEWTKVDKNSDFSDSMVLADSVLITFESKFQNINLKIGAYFGAGFSQTKGELISNKGSLNENFLFVCLNDREVERFYNIDLEISISSKPYSLSIFDRTSRSYITSTVYANLPIYKWLIDIAKKEYGKVLTIEDLRSLTDLRTLWLGSTSMNLHKARNSDCIYGSNHIAKNLRDSFELLRPNNNTFFVPKDLTLNEFLKIAIPTTQETLESLLIYHEQHIITLNSKLVDLKPSSENQSLFQIQDLRVVCLDNPEQLNKLEITSPVQVYKNIVSRYSSKLRTPVLDYLLSEGGPMDILKKIAPGGSVSKEFLDAYKVILEKIGPYAPALGSIMGKDIVLILYEILFIRHGEKNLDEDSFIQNGKKIFIPRILQKTVLKYLQRAQLQACDPSQLYEFLRSAITDVFERDALVGRPPLKLQSIMNRYQNLLYQLKQVDIIQDNYLIGLLLSSLFKDQAVVESHTQIIEKNLSKPLQLCSEIENLLSHGFDIIIPYCSDQLCNKNFTRLAQNVTAFINIKAYPSTLTGNGLFLEMLLDLVTQFKNQIQGPNSEIYVDSTIEDMLLNLINFVFTTLSQVMQAKQDLSPSQVNVVEVLNHTLGIFNFLQDQLKKSYERKNILPNQIETLVEIVDNAATVLKMLAHEQVLIAQGHKAAQVFSEQYLAKIESVYTAQTLVQVFSLLDSINDDSLFFQILAPILELIEAWSKNSYLVKIFEIKVQDPKGDEIGKTMPFFEYFMKFSKKLESANQIAQLIAKNSEIDKEELKANKKAVIVRVCTLFKSIQDNLKSQ